MPRTARKQPKAVRARSRAGKRGEALPQELALESDDAPSGRIGDPLSPRDIRNEFPRRRAREAGMSGGEVPGGPRLTADDLAPETLLDDDASHTPWALATREPLDSVLQDSDARGIGAGHGEDEAELARRQPMPDEELRRVRRRVARSGGPASNFEPHESAAGSPARARSAAARRR